MTADQRAQKLQQLSPDDWRLWRIVRLQALDDAPHAFGTLLSEWQGEGDLLALTKTCRSALVLLAWLNRHRHPTVEQNFMINVTPPQGVGSTRVAPHPDTAVADRVCRS